MVCKDFIETLLNTCAKEQKLPFCQYNKSGPFFQRAAVVIVEILKPYFFAITVMNVMSDIAVPSIPIAVE